jgi:hypothetical protein
LLRVVRQKLADVSEVPSAYFTAMVIVMEAVITSETSVNLHQIARRNLPADSNVTYPRPTSRSLWLIYFALLVQT